MSFWSSTPHYPPFELVRLQERKRREAVERRLDVLNREASAIRLQLRRLGVK